jgi:ATP-dependent DNA ligase
MSSESTGIDLWKAKPFQKIIPWKSIKAGYRTAEFFDIEEAIKAVTYLLPGIYVQPKMDGNRIFLHCEGEKAMVITEDGEDITEKLPKVCDDMKSQGLESFIYDTELIGIKNGKHLTRSQVAGYLHRKEPLGSKEEWLVAVVHDLLYLNGKSLVDEGYKVRYELLKEKLKPKKHISLMPNKVANTVDELRNAIKWSFSY